MRRSFFFNNKNMIPSVAVTVAALLMAATTTVSAFFVPVPVPLSAPPVHPTATSVSSSSSSTTVSSSVRLQFAKTAAANDDGAPALALTEGDPVLLVGPGFLQLVLARHLLKAGLRPVIVASQSQLDSFFQNLIKDDLEGYSQLLEDSTIGMPEQGDPFFGQLKGVVFCAEDAVLPPEFVSRVLDFQDGGMSPYEDNGDSGGNGPTRVICALPVSNKVQREKSNSWIPIFNMDRKQDETWKKFERIYKDHNCMKSKGDGTGVGSIVRFGSLFGGSTDGPDLLKDLGLDEGMYKMSLEQYRDMRERAFDRYKLAAQVIMGDSINRKPDGRDELEKQALSKYPSATREAYTILAEYPEQDRSNRHTVAAAITKMLMRPVSDDNNGSGGGSVARELTVLSKARSELPTDEEWDTLLNEPSAAGWPDPNEWDPSEYGLIVEKEKV